MTTPILSLVVPTKDRQKYLEQVVDAFSELNDTRIELVIHDNSEFALQSTCLNLSGVKYIHCDNQLSMHENFARAISYVDSPYLCVAGDDDFFCHYISQIIDYLENNDVSAIVSDKVTRYWWGDVSHRLFKKSLPGQLRVPWHRQKLVVSQSNTDIALVRCLQSGGTEISMLPKLYHGIVKTSIIHTLEKKYGSAFPGPTPDMAAAILLALHMPFFHRSSLPFFVSGTAGGSAGGKGVEKEHKWKLEDTPWFDKKYIDRWHINTPREASGPTLWAEGVLQSYETFGQDASLNWSALYSRVLAEGGISFSELRVFVSRNEDMRYCNNINLVIILLGYLAYQFKRSVSFLENLTYVLLGFSWKGKSYRACDSPVEVVKLIRLHARRNNGV